MSISLETDSVNHVRIWPVVVALALMLSGCSVVTAPHGGISDTELATMQQRALDVRWQHTGLPDSMRPPAVPVQTVSNEEWAPAWAGCMNAAGFDNYRVQGNGVSIEFVKQTPEEDDANALALYVCETSIRVGSQETFVYNPAQLDYLYDYYRDVLTPCLLVRDIELDPEQVLTREQFSDAFGGWNPYAVVTQNMRERLIADDSIFDECPPEPPGIVDRGWAAAFGH